MPIKIVQNMNKYLDWHRTLIGSRAGFQKEAKMRQSKVNRYRRWEKKHMWSTLAKHIYSFFFCPAHSFFFSKGFDQWSPQTSTRLSPCWDKPNCRLLLGFYFSQQTATNANLLDPTKTITRHWSRHFPSFPISKILHVTQNWCHSLQNEHEDN